MPFKDRGPRLSGHCAFLEELVGRWAGLKQGLAALAFPPSSTKRGADQFPVSCETRGMIASIVRRRESQAGLPVRRRRCKLPRELR
jgi:hypothetical protein